jgi:hypothetical protein
MPPVRVQAQAIRRYGVAIGGSDGNAGLALSSAPFM